MSVPVALRTDFTRHQLRALAKQSKDAAFARRLLSLAEIFDGGSRSDAARIGGVGLQTIRDWVLRFNAKGPEGLKDGKAPGQPSLLKDEHRRALAQKIENGPNPAADGVVRWRLIDLAQWIFRGLSHLGDQADPEPGTARHGLSQALGTAAPSCPGRRRCGRF